jgi:hypothetical protein
LSAVFGPAFGRSRRGKRERRVGKRERRRRGKRERRVGKRERRRRGRGGGVRVIFVELRDHLQRRLDRLQIAVLEIGWWVYLKFES